LLAPKDIVAKPEAHRRAWWSPLGAIESLLERLLTAHQAVARSRWFVLVMAATGILAGGGLVALRASNATSYLSDRPEACINCHIMVPYYASWERSSHSRVASCNDCHVPHDNLLRKLWFKAMDGLRHTTVFTMRREAQTLILNPAAVPVVRQNCVRCHEHQIMNTRMGSSDDPRLCWDCHRAVPHGLEQSLSSSPHVLRPRLPSAGMPRRQGRPAGVPWRQGPKP
jgi:cytochrome c nitrite reductase small subunit